MFRKLPYFVAALAATTITSFAQYSVSGPGGVFPPPPGTGGGGDSGSTLPTEFSVFTLTTPVPASASNIKSVTITGLTHTWVGDIQATLWAPGMSVGYNLFVRIGLAAPGTCCGNSSDFTGGTYTLVKAGDPSITVAAWPAAGNPTPGTYAQEYGTSYGTGWISGSGNVFNTDIGSIPAVAGLWSLVLYDGAGGDSGSITGWTLAGDTGPSSTTFCPGDGTGTACPCANNGSAGNGCANSIVATGAHIALSGTPSISADTAVLTGTGMPNSSALYFQGTAQVAAGAGAAFGDGKRCAGGTVTRLGTKTNAAGTSSYPVGADPLIHVKGNDVAGNTRQYQVWYRNADPVFCTPSTFNLSNGVEFAWVP